MDRAARHTACACEAEELSLCLHLGCAGLTQQSRHGLSWGSTKEGESPEGHTSQAGDPQLKHHAYPGNSQMPQGDPA